VYPGCLSNLLNDVLNNAVKIYYQPGTPIFAYNKITLSLPLRALDEDVIVYSACGSCIGYRLFQNLTLKNQIKQHCIQHLAMLPDNNYLCIHVRNTDYKCNYQKLYIDNKELINSFGTIYVATDDKHVITFFKTKHPNVFNFTNFPSESKYRSLHTSTINPIVKMNDMLCDIFIAANSKQILSNSAGGFIRLMRACFDNKGVVMNKLK
jgi:hypothetical protein